VIKDRQYNGQVIKDRQYNGELKKNPIICKTLSNSL
jgi:hypothetical protein